MFEHITKFANEATTTVTDAINDNDISERFTTTSDQVLDAVLDANRRIVDAAVYRYFPALPDGNIELVAKLIRHNESSLFVTSP